MTSDWPDLRADERRRDDLAAQAWLNEAQRHRGVCWSGVFLQAPPRRSDVQIEAAAEARLQKLEAWRASAAGRFLAAVSRAQQAAEAAHLAGETGRVAVARGFETSAGACRTAAEALETQGRALLAAGRAARRALQPGEAEQEPHHAC